MSPSKYATTFDLDDPQFPNSFDEVAAEVLEHCPVAHSPAMGGYKVVFRDEDIRRIAADWKLWSNAFGFEPSRSSEGGAKLYPLEIDPPYQSSWRKVIGKHLSSRAVAKWEDHIRRHANALIDELIEAGECDFVEAYAGQLPGRVFFSTIFGVPIEDIPYLKQATDDAVCVPRGENETDEEYVARRADGWNRIGAYLDGYMRKRHNEEPRGDIVDAVLGGVEMPDGEPAPWEHKLFIMVDVVAGGMATTTFVLAGIAHFLATHPEERERLATDPSLHANALEELFRYNASVLALGRTAMEDTEINGEPVKKGEMVMLAYAVGCRDPRVHENSDRIDIERGVKGNLAFGWGPHRCPGNFVARLQASITLEELLRRMPDLALAEDGESAISHSTVTRNWDTLPLTFTPGEREDAPIQEAS